LSYLFRFCFHSARHLQPKAGLAIQPLLAIGLQDLKQFVPPPFILGAKMLLAGVDGRSLLWVENTHEVHSGLSVPTGKDTARLLSHDEDDTTMKASATPNISPKIKKPIAQEKTSPWE
jgi:hypothetical protein